MAGHIGSAGNVGWNTPDWILNKVRRTFGGEVDLDPCSNKESRVAAMREFLLPHNDGLTEPWLPARNIFVNFPFGRCAMHRETREILAMKAFQDLSPAQRTEYRVTTGDAWLDLCAQAGAARVPTIAVCPANVDTKGWHTHVADAAAACLLEGRVKFVGAKSCAPMPIAIVAWGVDPFAFAAEWSDAGMVIFPHQFPRRRAA